MEYLENHNDYYTVVHSQLPSALVYDEIRSYFAYSFETTYIRFNKSWPFPLVSVYINALMTGLQTLYKGMHIF